MFCVFKDPDETEAVLEQVGFWKDPNNALRKHDAELRIYGSTKDGKWLVEVISDCIGILRALTPWALINTPPAE